jgi:hypothetical protein
MDYVGMRKNIFSLGLRLGNLGMAGALKSLKKLIYSLGARVCRLIEML